MDNKDYKLYKQLKAKAKEGKLDAKGLVQLTRLEELLKSSKSGSGSKAGASKKGRGSGANDPAWYKNYPQYYESVTNIPFNNKAGISEDLGANYQTKIPGCWRIDGIQTIGKATNGDDGFNYQARLLWLDMHRKYRGIGTYESSDLGIALFAILDFFGQVERAKRVYGSLMNYSIYNRNFPETILVAEHVKFDTITGDDLADFRANINRILIAAKSMCLPKGIAYLDYVLANFGNVFKDSDSPKATCYLYDSDYYVVFDGINVTTGSAASYKQHKYSSASYGGTSYHGSTLKDITDDLMTQLNSLLNDTDVQRMCSDFLAAYGDGGVITLTELNEDYTVAPVKDETRLLQFHNMKWTHTNVQGRFPNDQTLISSLDPSAMNDNWESWIIYQLDNVIMQDLVASSTGLSGNLQTYDNHVTWWSGAANIVKGDTLLDTWNDEVSNDEIMEMTRLTFGSEVVKRGSNNEYISDLVCYGVFLPMTVECWTHPEGNVGYDTTFFLSNQAQCIPQQASLGTRIDLINCLKVDWAPLIYILNNATWETNYQVAILGDLVNIKGVSNKNLKAIHDCAILSLFKVEAVTVPSGN